MDLWRTHGKGTVYFFIGIALAYVLSKNSFFQMLILHLGAFGYLGAFIAGMLFVSTFTVAIAVVVLITLAQFLSPLEISIIAGIGATVGNYGMFLFMNKKITRHVHKLIKKRQRKHHLHHISPYMHWFLPFLAALIIASPFPDEIGIFLLSLFNMQKYQFLLVSFALKFTGIFLLISGTHYIAS